MSPTERHPIALFTDFHDWLHQQEIVTAIQRKYQQETAGEAATILCNINDVERFSVPHGAFYARQLRRTYEGHLPSPIFVGVVDPTVGSDRAAVAVRTKSGSTFIGPNNGIFALALEEDEADYAVRIDEGLRTKPRTETNSFDGRDLFAPAAALVAAGEEIQKIGKEYPAEELIRPDWKPGTVLSVDGFGNYKLHGFDDAYESGDSTVPFHFDERNFHPSKVHSHNERRIGDLVALPGSSGLVEIWVVQGNARRHIGAAVGDVLEPIHQRN